MGALGEHWGAGRTWDPLRLVVREWYSRPSQRGLCWSRPVTWLKQEDCPKFRASLGYRAETLSHGADSSS